MLIPDEKRKVVLGCWSPRSVVPQIPALFWPVSNCHMQHLVNEHLHSSLTMRGSKEKAVLQTNLILYDIQDVHKSLFMQC